MRRKAFLAFLIACSASCFSPKYGSGDLQCASNGACPAGFHCGANNRCYALGTGTADLGMPKRTGESCAPGDRCESGHCVDGYCCDSACTDPCQACDVAASPGQCTAVPPGMPHGARTCMNQGTVCGGTCDGVGSMCS